MVSINCVSSSDLCLNSGSSESASEHRFIGTGTLIWYGSPKKITFASGIPNSAKSKKLSSQLTAAIVSRQGSKREFAKKMGIIHSADAIHTVSSHKRSGMTLKSFCSNS